MYYFVYLCIRVNPEKVDEKYKIQKLSERENYLQVLKDETNVLIKKILNTTVNWILFLEIGLKTS